MSNESQRQKETEREEEFRRDYGQMHKDMDKNGIRLQKLQNLKTV